MVKLIEISNVAEKMTRLDRKSIQKDEHIVIYVSGFRCTRLTHMNPKFEWGVFIMKEKTIPTLLTSQR